MERDDQMTTRFEKARILGARTLQISMGAPPTAGSNVTDPLSAAQSEYDQDLIPIAVKRRR